MFYKKIILISFIFFVQIPLTHKMLSSDLKASTLNTSEKNEVIKVRVKGMVCSFCAQGIKKSLGKKKAIQKVEVNLEKKLVIITNETKQTVSDKEIIQAIKESGYNVEKITRNLNK